MRVHGVAALASRRPVSHASRKFHTEAMSVRVLSAVRAALTLVSAALAVWYFADGRPIYGVVWLSIAAAWALISIRLWGKTH